MNDETVVHTHARTQHAHAHTHTNINTILQLLHNSTISIVILTISQQLIPNLHPSPEIDIFLWRCKDRYILVEKPLAFHHKLYEF